MEIKNINLEFTIDEISAIAKLIGGTSPNIRKDLGLNESDATLLTDVYTDLLRFRDLFENI